MLVITQFFPRLMSPIGAARYSGAASIVLFTRSVVVGRCSVDVHGGCGMKIRWRAYW